MRFELLLQPHCANRLTLELFDTNLYQDKRGFFHARVRVAGKLHKKALRTESIREARQALAEFQTDLRRARDGAKTTNASLETQAPNVRPAVGHDAAVLETIELLRAQISELRTQVVDSKAKADSDPGAPVPSAQKLAARLCERPLFPVVIAKYDALLESTCNKGSTYRMYHGDAENVLRFCSTWEEFDPPAIWGKRRLELREHHERIRRNQNKEEAIADTAGGTSLNQLKVFLNKFIHWCIGKQWLEPSFAIVMKDIKTMVVNPQKVNLPEASVMAEFFDLAESVDFQLGRFLRVTYLLACRKMSTLGLKWEDIDFPGQLVTLWVKRDRQETVPLLPEAAAALLAIRPSASATGRVFPLSDRQYKRAVQLVKTVVRTQGIENSKICAVKSLRSAMVSKLLELGFTPPEVAAIVCHQDGGVLVQKVYGKVRQSHLREKVARTRILKSDPAASAPLENSPADCEDEK